MKELYRNTPYMDREMTLLDLLDSVLQKGVVVAGGLILSIADVDLIYVDLRLLVTAIETITNGGESAHEPIIGTDSI